MLWRGGYVQEKGDEGVKVGGGEECSKESGGRGTDWGVGGCRAEAKGKARQGKRSRGDAPELVFAAGAGAHLQMREPCNGCQHERLAKPEAVEGCVRVRPALLDGRVEAGLDGAGGAGEADGESGGDGARANPSLVEGESGEDVEEGAEGEGEAEELVGNLEPACGGGAPEREEGNEGRGKGIAGGGKGRRWG